jgi:two-component system NtrC family response regulator/two-component system nitrogen regulation response regulator GlnG
MHTVALVDDCHYPHTTLALLLEPHGFHVVWFATGKEMLEQYDAVEGCVLLDTWLRYMDGFEVLERFRKRWGVPVIIMDATEIRGHRERALSLGAFDFVPKPWNMPELIALLQRACEADVPTIVDCGPRERPYYG